MVPDPVLQEFLTEELTYYVNREVAGGWMNYSAGNVIRVEIEKIYFKVKHKGSSSPHCFLCS